MQVEPTTEFKQDNRSGHHTPLDDLLLIIQFETMRIRDSHLVPGLQKQHMLDGKDHSELIIYELYVICCINFVGLQKQRMLDGNDHSKLIIYELHVIRRINFVTSTHVAFKQDL
uniref:Uncharacterized protein n=1 Tax=Gossypium raimondii TaxID=29730 RepID=A0A0D2TVJ9_GOSRA|nr:hypothetical protein B456_008G023100 [Gossypium raimondii]